MPDRIRRARWLVAVALTVLVLGRAPAAGASEPLEDSVRIVPDTSGHKPHPPTSLSRLLAHADSVVKAQGGARADNAQLYLSWNAPWGSKRAQQARKPACSDSTVEDTLFLSFLPGRTGKTFTGFTAQIFFHATAGDTLGPWWHMEGKGGENAGAMRAEWAGVPGFGWKQPFPVTGQGLVLLDRTPQVARLRMVFAVPYDGAGPVAADSVYSLCRLIFKHHPSRALAGCERPVCVEWGKATLGFGPKDEPEVSRGERFVAFSGAYAICEPFKGPRVAAWKPPPKPAPATKPQ
jgi:hypothetical protein